MMRGWITAAVLGSLTVLGATYAGRKAPESEAATLPAPPAPKPGLSCELWSWIDVAASQGNPKLAPLRQKLLAGAADAGAIQALSAPIEQGAETVSLCMGKSTDGSGKSSKVLVIQGHFPADLAGRLQQTLPHVQPRQISGQPVLASENNWLSLNATRLIWASDQAALQSALEDRLVTPPLAPGLATLTSLTPRAKFPGISELAMALGLRAGEWERLSLSMPRDASSSELRVYAATDNAAKKLFQVARDQLDEVRASPLPAHQQTASKLTVEAEGDSVAFRFAGGLDELASSLQQLRPKKAHGHDHE